ncbi:MAG: hypothetical protein C4527_01865 [Candidatus Omnitrophota bacterium]|jgi:pyruvate carboxylase|nr:MAG: hypothetical protein C4527_01865 [Candidatus Omnitrophota bacterium]
MRLADFQNPIANMPHMQQMQESQNQQARFLPIAASKTLQEEVREEQTTVKESKETQEKDKINEEDTDRGDKKRRLPRKRARTLEEEAKKTKIRLQDGIHGLNLDIEV